MNDQLLNKVNSFNKEEEYIDFIKLNLKCPIVYSENNRLSVIEQQLVDLWKITCSKYSTAYEEDFINDYGEEETILFQIEDLDEFKRVSLNLIGWIDTAKNEFIELVNVFNSTMANSNEYPKHFLKSKMSGEALKKKAKLNKISYFYLQVNEQYL